MVRSHQSILPNNHSCIDIIISLLQHIDSARRISLPDVEYYASSTGAELPTNSERLESPEVPAELAAIALAYGDRLGDVIASWLDSQGQPSDNRAEKAPLPYLLELGAVLQLAVWESAGFADQLPAELPTLSQARDELKTRAALGPQEFEDPRKAQLFAKVFLVWWEHFSWQAPELLNAEVLLGQLGEDELVQELAQFFWDTRHIANICNEEQNNGKI